MTIVLSNDQTAKCWTAKFLNSSTMPNGQWLPLPFGNDASFYVVADDLQRRFRNCTIHERGAR